MNGNINVETRINKLLERLALSPNEEEVRDGWTVEGKKAISNLLNEILTRLRSGEPIPPISIARGMDSWGVGSGDLLTEGASISNELRALSTKS